VVTVLLQSLVAVTTIEKPSFKFMCGQMCYTIICLTKLFTSEVSACSC